MNGPKDPSRRQAIRYIIGGAVATACPVPAAQLASMLPAVRLGSERNEICHQIRDGVKFELPKPSTDYEVILIGGGLQAASHQFRAA